MKKRVITISAIVAGIIVIGALFLFVLLPRLMIYKSVQEFILGMGKSAEYFTEYSVTNDSFSLVDNGEFSVKIPYGLELQDEISENLMAYENSDESMHVLMIKGYDASHLNMFDPENYTDVSETDMHMELEELTEGFEIIGKGYPDSAYGSLKCMHLIDSDDYNFWDLKSARIFAVMGYFKAASEPLMGHDIFIYEQEKICGIVGLSCRENADTGSATYNVQFEFFKTDDLNTEYVLIIRAESLDEAYAIINSVEFI
ncbi:MAG: hypothetical protein HDT24_00470 [Ruminococcus sp.]|nr:hypothetical protein [Ruminococcus sp.]